MTIRQLLRPWLGTGLILGAISVVAAPSVAQSQAFPSGPIRIFVPTAPSTSPDIISRVIANEMAKSEGWKVVVENHPGAITITIAGSEVLKRPRGWYVRLCHERASNGSASFSSEHAIPAGQRLCSGHQSCDVVQCSGRASVGSSQFRC